MKIEDVKIGMRVVYQKGTEDEDFGTVTDIDSSYRTVWCSWEEEDYEVQSVHPSRIEPAETQPQQPNPKAGSFTVNPGKTTLKVVEVQEEETYTITLSKRAAHELRALMGASTGGFALFNETEQLRNILWDDPLRLMMREGLDELIFDPRLVG